MSTPVTATATLQPSHFDYHRSHHNQSYLPPHVNRYTFNYAELNPPSRPPPSSSFNSNASSSTAYGSTQTQTMQNQRQRQPQRASHAAADSHQASAAVAGTKRQRTPVDWVEYYGGANPPEIIVIHDDDSPLPPSRVSAKGKTNARKAVDSPSAAPAAKKRRTGYTGHPYDAVSGKQASNTATQTPHYAAPNSGSTDSYGRVSSANETTAPTSLGSNHSHTGSIKQAHRAMVAPVTQTQKRKVTRKTVADEAKKRQVEKRSHYHPPPKPPIKAREVQVNVIREGGYSNQVVDDEDGHYIVSGHNQDVELTSRYQIIKLLGQGTFGKVVEAYDKHLQKSCAIKIIRSVQKYRDASKIELRVLSTLKSNDPHNHNRCIHLRDCFDFRNHICIVTDLLGSSVFDFLKQNQFVPFPSSQIQNFARQLLTSVAFLHDLNLIHTDLKPENILLVDTRYQKFTYNRTIPSSSTCNHRTAKERKVLLDTDIRLIDFGSATFNDEYHSFVVSTRHYRAPEIILGLGWSFPCDIWSIGCILVEFFTGDALFQTHDNLEHLAMMEHVVGRPIEPKLVRTVTANSRTNASNVAGKYFKRTKLDYPTEETSKASRRYVRAMKCLDDIIPRNNAFNKQFLDLLTKIFVYDPKDRITAKEALDHPWFAEETTDDGTEALKLRRQRLAELRQSAIVLD